MIVLTCVPLDRKGGGDTFLKNIGINFTLKVGMVCSSEQELDCGTRIWILMCDAF